MLRGNLWDGNWNRGPLLRQTMEIMSLSCYFFLYGVTCGQSYFVFNFLLALYA